MNLYGKEWSAVDILRGMGGEGWKEGVVGEGRVCHNIVSETLEVTRYIC